MGEMGIERGYDTNLTIRKLCKIAICKDETGQISKKPGIAISRTAIAQR
jgi:hypothetical protein